jgi:hypothetical protein
MYFHINELTSLNYLNINKKCVIFIKLFKNPFSWILRFWNNKTQNTKKLKYLKLRYYTPIPYFNTTGQRNTEWQFDSKG